MNILQVRESGTTGACIDCEFLDISRQAAVLYQGGIGPHNLSAMITIQ